MMITLMESRLSRSFKVLPFLLLSLMSLLGIGNATAQTTTTESDAGTSAALSSNVFGIGLSASLCSGMGLTFRHHLANVPLAYQVTGGPWKSGSLLMYDVGAEFQYDLSLSENRLYAVLGGGYYYYGDS